MNRRFKDYTLALALTIIASIALNSHFSGQPFQTIAVFLPFGLWIICGFGWTITNVLGGANWYQGM